MNLQHPFANTAGHDKDMEKEFLELKTLTVTLSESLSVMVMEKVDSLFTHQRQVMCARYQLRNGAFSRV